ncbi:MAG TPA: hypothetical protein VMT62_05040 [Syntrophorhabdaceae bacterium]|nr:hypothetical protein [Syntrophorhabdaceae bacterium]
MVQTSFLALLTLRGSVTVRHIFFFAALLGLINAFDMVGGFCCVVASIFLVTRIPAIRATIHGS